MVVFHKPKDFVVASCECGCHQQFLCRKSMVGQHLTPGGVLVNPEQVQENVERLQDALFLAENCGHC